MPPICIFLVYLTIQGFVIVLFEKTALTMKNIQHKYCSQFDTTKEIPSFTLKNPFHL